MNRHAIASLLAILSLAIPAGCASNRLTTRSSAGVVPRETSDSAKTVANHSTRIDSGPAESANSATGPEIQLVAGDAGFSDNSHERQDQTAPAETAAVPPQPPATGSASRTISLAELEEIALRHNPTLIQAQAEIEVDQGYLKQAGLYPNPQAGYYNATASNPSVHRSNGAFLSQEIVTGRKLQLAQESIRQEIKQMQWDQVAQRVRVLNDLKIRYYEVLGAQQAVAIAGKLVDVASETLVMAERIVEAKEGTRSDVLQARMQLDTARLSLNEAELRYTAAWEQMAVIIGMPSLEATPVTGELTEQIPDLEFETCWQRLLTDSPQLNGSASQLDHGFAEYRSQRAQAIPNVTIQTVVDYDQATLATTATTLVSMPIPFNDNRNSGNIDKAAADIRLFQAEITRVELVLRDQLTDSFKRYRVSRRQAEVLKQSILPNAEENLKLTREIYAAKQSNFTPVLAAQQSYFLHQMAYIEALTELNKVVVEIEGLQLTGGLNPPAIGSAIQAQPGGGAQRQRALLKEAQDRTQKQLLPAAQFAQ